MKKPLLMGMRRGFERATELVVPVLRSAVLISPHRCPKRLLAGKDLAPGIHLR
jgi:hypothetical protein